MISKAKLLILMLLTLLAMPTFGEMQTETQAVIERAFTSTAISKQKLFKVTATLKDTPQIPINQFHQWVITITDANNQPVYPARIAITGGMPAHGHGLPTQPVATKYLDQGRYLIEGMKFNMDGAWQLRLQIMTPSQQDVVEIDVTVNY